MNLHCYFHDDLDGTGSSVVFLEFLRQRGGNFLSYQPLRYTNGLKEKWPDFVFKTPFVLTDFMYHPRADWWYDHHESSFNKDEWRQAYKDDQQHGFDASAPSCCGFILRRLVEQYHYQPSDRVVELAKIADIIDSANFSTIAEAVDLDSSGRQLDIVVNGHNGSPEDETYIITREKLIENLLTQGVGSVLALPESQQHIKQAREELARAREYIKQNGRKFGSIVYQELDKTTSGGLARFLPYEIFPEAVYSLVILPHDKGSKVGVAVNPWRKKESKVHLGELMQGFGGGGHQTVAATEASSFEEARHIAQTIMEKIQKIHE